MADHANGEEELNCGLPQEQRFEMETEINTISNNTTQIQCTKQSQQSSVKVTAAETESSEINNAGEGKGEESESTTTRSQSQSESIVPIPINELDTSGCGEQPLSDSSLLEKHKTSETQFEPECRDSSVTSSCNTVSIICDEIQPVLEMETERRNSPSPNNDLSKEGYNEERITGGVSTSSTIPPIHSDTDNKSPDSDNEIEGDSEIWFDTREDTASVSDDSLRAASAASLPCEAINSVFSKLEAETERQSPISGPDSPESDNKLFVHRGEIPPPPDFDDENENNEGEIVSSSSETSYLATQGSSLLETVNSCSEPVCSSNTESTSQQLQRKASESTSNKQKSKSTLNKKENQAKSQLLENTIPIASENCENDSVSDGSAAAGSDDDLESDCDETLVKDENIVVQDRNSKQISTKENRNTLSTTDSDRDHEVSAKDVDLEQLDEFASDEDEDDGDLLNLETGGGGGGRTSRSSGRRSSFARRGSVCEEGYVEDSSIMDFLEDVQEGAEARLAARRQARAEAREIRMKELEKQQKESEENADRHYDMYSSGNDVANRAAFRVALGSHRAPAHSVGSGSYHSSRRSSEDSSEDGIVNIRDMRHELKELEDKFRKSMVQNAQLDNEKSALTYHVELLKDKIEDLEESLSLLQREHKDKCRDFENLKRLSTQLKDELEYYKSQLQEKDELIKEYGLVVVENEVEVDLGNGERETRIKRTLVTQQTAQVLSTLGDGSLDVRLKKVLEEKNELLDEIRRLKLDLEEERNRNAKGDRSGGLQNNISHNSSHTMNGPDGHASHDTQREATKQMADYRFKTQKYEQEIATLQANVTRLETQVSRFKTAAEEAESREDDLKVEKRKLQREFREAQSKLDELETTNSHLQKRLDKLKTAKSTLLKEL